ncbi:putative sugar phosphate isomerase YwlF [Pseudobythopirellula maris]|uniref:Putative sugar phosphate isomerase YwlF n=1 Tax=Pseudobythopirellula maris TaxID=2527991 RepID=A0A5C5ZRN9_9BACT|nr:ribose 5-phosphate isomerase B [Pseudobythopirellula maris]TWT90179.1 putative sugar phosphate isomerase YwlF [Pseudobythopirellula maris]
MRIAVASDHRGLDLRNKVINVLESLGHEAIDEGSCGSESVDYPDFAAIVAGKVSKGEVDRGILICGTGIGMAVAANKFCGVRAAPCTDEVTAEISRRHNNLNVLCLSADLLSPRVVERMVEVWVNTEFEGARHARRVEKITQLERDYLGRKN